MTLPVDPWLRSLRVFVVVAGIVLVVGTGALLWLLVTRAQEPNPDVAASRIRTAAPDQPLAATAAPIPPMRPAAASSPVPVIADLPLPKGASILDLRFQADRIVLLVRTTDDNDYLAVVDAATGKRLALLRVVPEPP